MAGAAEAGGRMTDMDNEERTPAFYAKLSGAIEDAIALNINANLHVAVDIRGMSGRQFDQEIRKLIDDITEKLESVECQLKEFHLRIAHSCSQVISARLVPSGSPAAELLFDEEKHHE